METASLVNDIEKAQIELEQNAPGARSRLLELAQALTASLETPSEAIQRIAWAEPARFACIRTAVDLKIFEKMLESKSALTSSELAAATGAESGLIARVMKHLAAMNVVEELDSNTYRGTKLSEAFTEPKFRAGIIYCYDVAGPSFRQMPMYLAQTSYRMPTSLFDGPFQHAHSTQLPFFGWLGENPPYLAAFNAYMMGYRAGKPTWSSFYPAKERLLSEEDAEVLLVDVGGGMAHDLEDFKARFPEAKGKLVLQERPEVISQIQNLSPGIEATEHDFFTAQPVISARAYYLHSVLHDWDDASCIKILSKLKPAMMRSSSKLLINELIVPDTKASWAVTSMDWLMLALGAVRERTEADWRKIIKEAGFEIAGIWTAEQGTESLIEAVVSS